MTINTLLEVVTSDLQYLKANWTPEVDDHSLRRGSTILRMLLVEGNLQRAWKSVGMKGKPTIIAPRLEVLLDGKDKSSIVAAFAGGGEYKGIYVALGVINRGSKAARYSPQDSKPTEHPFGLREFMESCGVFLNGEKIKRRDVVKYVANKLGGAHLDFTRKDAGRDHVYVLLDTVGPLFQVLDKGIVYYELLSIGQLLIRSPDIQVFMNALRR